MNPVDPIDPSTEPIEAPPFPNPQPPIASPQREPFWDYTDVLLFVLLIIGSLGVALLVGLFAFTKFSLAFRLIIPQILWYALAFGSLKLLLMLRYGQPFWRSLGWRSIPFSTALGVLLAGPALAIGVGLLGAALHTRQIDLPFQQMLGTTPAKILLGFVVVILGPLCEELAFRGFLMPLLIRSLGAVGGIVVTGVIFGSAHGYEYEWSWQYMLLISLVGCALGWAKYKTGSTAASAFMHATFNLTQFVAFLFQSRSL
jgi:hypothetical protein